MIGRPRPAAVDNAGHTCRQVQRKFLRSADLIVGLGYDTIEVEYEAWIGDGPLLHVDIEAAGVTAAVKLVHQVIADLSSSLAGLAQASTEPAQRWASKQNDI